MTVAPPPPPNTPAGWYPDAGGQRYWDGLRWTEHRAPASAPTKLDSNRFGDAGTPLGILAIAGTLFLPGFGFLFGILPVLLGVTGIWRANVAHQKRGASIAAVVLGGLCILIGLVVWLR